MRTEVALPSFLERHRILNVKQGADLLGYSVAHTRRLYRTGKIPKPITIGGHNLGWPAGVLMDLIDASSNQEAA